METTALFFSNDVQLIFETITAKPLYNSTNAVEPLPHYLYCPL
ncbi:hypothetical protein T01_3849 [Trichinella spiralis]|uniref:Uncharacterized protein n=1 Tax=Trichinella spiralis TaxID=6334 RepID=A0A0V0YXD2_TRISP|nr:hypothetical protein T01_3849 [Trichinella spiralis]